MYRILCTDRSIRVFDFPNAAWEFFYFTTLKMVTFS